MSLPILHDDKFHDECGVFGAWNLEEAANLAYLALYQQQHRGQEGAGVLAVSDRADGGRWNLHRGLGLVSEVFNKFDFGRLPGKIAIGHVRYSTAGGSRVENIQPFQAELSSGNFAVAHNGNLVNADALKEALKRKGAIFRASSDTEILLHLLARESDNVPPVERIIAMLKQLKGAYSLVMLLDDRMFAVRDPHGVRPLVMAESGNGVVFASETCAFNLLQVKNVREVAPGEIIEVRGENTVTSYRPFPNVPTAKCIFEHVYFARPDSDVFDKHVQSVRRRLGEQLAKESPVEADLVIPVPDSGNFAALGYSRASGIPFDFGFIRNHYVGRTFIEPQQGIRDFGVKLKLSANQQIVEGKRIVVIDDSVVRGTTSRKLVAMLRAAGAKEIHMRISSPPTINPCFYGIDTPSKDQLIAAQKTKEEIRQFFEADSLEYLSLEGLHAAVESDQNSFCDACFSGNYRAGIPSDFTPRQVPLL
jgi:amidophosphoribosyltransferase